MITLEQLEYRLSPLGSAADLQTVVDLEALEVIHREEDGLGLSAAGQGDPLMLLAYPPGQLRQACLGLRQRYGRRGCGRG
jgi:hypothetical protein